MTEQELQALCAVWQRRLRLQDWDVTVRVVRHREMEDIKDGAECIHCDKLRTAQVLLMDPIDFPDDALAPQDHELDLVHELLHLHFAPFRADDDSPEQIAQEQAIHAISAALVALGRAGEPEREDQEAANKGELQ